MKFSYWFLTLLVVVLLVACVNPQSTSSQGSSEMSDGSESEEAGTVTVVSWGGAYQEAQTKAYFDPYAEETGVTIIQDSPVDYAKIIAMVESGQVTWDVVVPENSFGIGKSEQYFEPIDYTIVPKDQILPSLTDEYRVGNILYATVLGYNTEVFPDPPQSWADFFDLEKFPGTRSLPRDAFRYAMEMSLVADGVAPEDLYPLDMERALAKLNTIKDETIFWETGSQSAQQLADGEAVMGMLWNGRIQTAIDEGAPLAIQWNQHIALADYLAVPKGSPNKEEAMKLIAYIVGSEHNHRIADFISYAPVNVETFEKINEEMAPLLPTYGDRPSQSFLISDAWWDENLDVAIERYNAWLLE